MTEYLNMWKNYVNFNDRTSVRGYWMAYLFNVIASAIVLVIVKITGLAIISSLYSLAAFLPSLALTVRRLRDAGKKWTMIFVAFIPLAGVIWLIILLCGATNPQPEDAALPQV